MLSPVRRLYRGAQALVGGVRQTAGHRGVRTSFLVILLALSLLSVVLTVSGLVTLWHFTPVEDAAGWRRIAWWLLRLAAGAFLVLLSPLLSLTIVNLVAPVFAEIPFIAGLAHLAPREAARLSQSPGLGLSASIVNSVRRLVPFLLLSALYFLVGLIPIVGPPLAVVGQLHNGARSLGWELLDPYFDKEKIPFSEQRKIVERLHWERLGLGLAATPLLSIPFLGPLFFPLLQAGAARFVVDFLLEVEGNSGGDLGLPGHAHPDPPQ